VKIVYLFSNIFGFYFIGFFFFSIMKQHIINTIPFLRCVYLMFVYVDFVDFK
jgi:hypothetical protein